MPFYGGIIKIKLNEHELIYHHNRDHTFTQYVTIEWHHHQQQSSIN